MTPAGRLAAAIEVLDALAAERGPADEALKAWGRAHRFAGAKDRRAIAERVYACLRARVRLAWAMGADDGRALVLGALARLDGLSAPGIEVLFTGEAHAPGPLSAAERERLAAPASEPPDHVRAGVAPFIAEALQAGFGDEWMAEAQALIGARAPLDLRLNTLRGGRDAALRLLAHDDLKPEPTPWSALGLRLPAELAPDIQKTRAFADGWIEVQDEASQIAVALAGARPGMTVVDYCAGGGGKTLGLAAAMARSGRLLAFDVNARRLDAMKPRLERAGGSAEIRRIGPEGEGSEDLQDEADLVFVDAPCSGSGTWRRHPEAAWRLTPETVARLSALQREIVVRAARLVRPGGRLVYATCSVFEAENGATAAAFAQARPDFRPVAIAEAARTPLLTPAAQARLVELAQPPHTLQLTPRRTGTDGFYLALFERLP